MTRGENTETRRRYFVDESGDGVLFDAGGRVLIGDHRAPAHFILGLVEVGESEALQQELETLRAALLADPYFKRVPSMQLAAGKTARQFHAKDDLPEVRREVFAVLLRHPIKFSCVVKSMSAVQAYVHGRNAMDSTYRYHPNELYDLTVRRLFKERLHKHASYEVIFARRGKSDRTRALREQLLLARRRFLDGRGVESNSTVEVLPSHPHEHAGLQTVDYFLWAVQRLFERGEERFVELIWPKLSLLIDIDDKSQNAYGRYYTRKDAPLTAERMKQRRV